MTSLLALAVLLVLPGCWPVFAFRRSALDPAARLALAAILSPIVTAIGFVALRAGGLSDGAAALAVVLLSLPAMLLVVRALRGQRFEARTLVAGLAVYAAVAVCLAIPWLLEPEFRRYSWHGLFHTDVIYALTRSIPPEEPELAGVRLAYPWVGHVYWLALAVAADRSPTIVYVATNLALVASIGVLYSRLAIELGASREGGLVATVVLALGIGWTGLVGWSLMPPNESAAWWALLGDLRHAPFLQKFAAFEVMVFGLAAFVALAYIAVVELDQTRDHELLLAPALLFAIGALYPVLLPPATILLAGLLFAAPLQRRARPRPGGRMAGGADRWRWRPGLSPVALTAVAAALAALASVLFVQLYAAGRSQGLMEVASPPAMAKKAVFAVLAAAPFALAGRALWRGATSDRRRRLAVLGVTAFASLAANVVLRLGSLTEYKYIYAAGVCLVAPAVVWLEQSVLRSVARRQAFLAGAVLALAVTMAAYAHDQTPRGTAAAPAAREAAFHLALAASDPDAGWTDAVRSGTPAEAVLLVNRPDFHASTFTARALLAPSRLDRPHAGYSLDSRANLIGFRGYDPALYEARVRLLDAVYDDAAAAAPTILLADLAAVGRPLVIVVRPGDRTGFVRWLRERRIGRAVYADKHGYAVHLIERMP